MFNKTNKDRGGSSSRVTNSITLIAEGAKVSGEFHFSGSLEIHGVVHGKIIADGQKDAEIRILNGGSVIGEISVPTVIVNGYVKGEIFANSKAKLASKAVVEGDIHYNTLEIENGAKVSGELVHESPVNNVTDLNKVQEVDDKDNRLVFEDNT
jgi:cytoskeletal protein CcmA (bactofilin family)